MGIPRVDLSSYAPDDEALALRARRDRPRAQPAAALRDRGDAHRRDRRRRWTSSRSTTSVPEIGFEIEPVLAETPSRERGDRRSTTAEAEQAERGSRGAAGSEDVVEARRHRDVAADFFEVAEDEREVSMPRRRGRGSSRAGRGGHRGRRGVAADRSARETVEDEHPPQTVEEVARVRGLARASTSTSSPSPTPARSRCSSPTSSSTRSRAARAGFTCCRTRTTSSSCSGSKGGLEKIASAPLSHAGRARRRLQELREARRVRCRVPALGRARTPRSATRTSW